MAYFISNGALIGGGSLGRTEQLPTLKLLCVDLCARHLDRLSDLGDIPTEVFIDLLKRAKEKATPELVKRFQDVNERLWCDEVDTAFWKQAVEGHILRRTVPAPGPVLVERVNGYKERLNDLLAGAPSAGKSGGGGGSSSSSSSTLSKEDREWSREVTKVLEALEETPVAVALLKKTLVGKAVSPFRKSKDAKVARMAADLVQRWKEGAVAAAAAATPRAESNGGDGAAERRPAEEKQRAVEEGFRCRTWESLYQHLELLRAEKVRASSKRAREAREREELKRPKMIVGKSRGEDFTRKNGRISGKIRAPSFFAASSSSSRLSGRGGGTPPPRPPLPSISPHKGKTTPKKRLSSGSGGAGSGSGTGARGKSGSTGGNSGGGGGSSSSTSSSSSSKKGKKGVTSIAELRRKVVSDQRMSIPVHLRKPGGPVGGGGGSSRGGGGGGSAPLAPAKRRKFWK